MSMIEGTLFNRAAGLTVPASVDIEYGLVSADPEITSSASNFAFEFEGETFSVIREINGKLFISEHDIDDLRNHAMG